MRQSVHIGIIGDREPDRVSHSATERAIVQCAEYLGMDVQVTWLPTPSLGGTAALASFDGLWGAPGVYASSDGALAAIRLCPGGECPVSGHLPGLPARCFGIRAQCAGPRRRGPCGTPAGCAGPCHRRHVVFVCGGVAYGFHPHSCPNIRLLPDRTVRGTFHLHIRYPSGIPDTSGRARIPDRRYGRDRRNAPP